MTMKNILTIVSVLLVLNSVCVSSELNIGYNTKIKPIVIMNQQACILNNTMDNYYLLAEKIFGIKEIVTGGSGAPTLLELHHNDSNAGADLLVNDGVSMDFYVPEQSGDALGGRINVSRESNTDTNSASSMTLYSALDDGVLTQGLKISSTGTVTVNNLIINGNFSAKRPYISAYDNTTQNFLNTSATQVVNISTVDDSYLMGIENRQNITFQLTGDYQITFEPILYVSSGSNKHIAFWIDRWNGTNWSQVPWSNSRIEIASQDVEYAPSITYQIDVDNTNIKYRISWWSDTTNAQMPSFTGLTSPTRPNVPSIILLVSKVSEIT